MVPEYEGQHKPKTQIRAGAAICLVSIAAAVGFYLHEGWSWSTSNMVFAAACGAWLFKRGRDRTEATEAEHAVTPSMSSGSDIAKRWTLIFACSNIGIVATMTWQYFQTGLPVWIFVVAGLISLALMNGLVFFMYKKATSRSK